MQGMHGIWVLMVAIKAWNTGLGLSNQNTHTTHDIVLRRIATCRNAFKLHSSLLRNLNKLE